MSALKEEVQIMIGNLPDDGTVEDIQYHLYVIEKDKTLSHKEAQEKMQKWL